MNSVTSKKKNTNSLVALAINGSTVAIDQLNMVIVISESNIDVKV